MAIYRRRRFRQVWHWRPDCRWWPRFLFVEKLTEGHPWSGELCNECIAKTKRDDATMGNWG